MARAVPAYCGPGSGGRRVPTAYPARRRAPAPAWSGIDCIRPCLRECVVGLLQVGTHLQRLVVLCLNDGGQSPTAGNGIFDDLAAQKFPAWIDVDHGLYVGVRRQLAQRLAVEVDDELVRALRAAGLAPRGDRAPAGRYVRITPQPVQFIDKV